MAEPKKPDKAKPLANTGVPVTKNAEKPPANPPVSLTDSLETPQNTSLPKQEPQKRRIIPKQDEKKT